MSVWGLRAVKAAVVLMTLAIIVLGAILVRELSRQFGADPAERPAPPPAQAADPVAITLVAGWHIIEIDTFGDRLALLVEQDGGSRRLLLLTPEMVDGPVDPATLSSP